MTIADIANYHREHAQHAGIYDRMWHKQAADRVQKLACVEWMLERIENLEHAIKANKNKVQCAYCRAIMPDTTEAMTEHAAQCVGHN